MDQNAPVPAAPAPEVAVPAMEPTAMPDMPVTPEVAMPEAPVAPAA